MEKRLNANQIMWFFIAEGCHYTRNMGKYIGRLFLICCNIAFCI